MTRARIALATALLTFVVGIFMSMPGTAFADGHTVAISSASRNGASATVNGLATFAPITGPESVGGVDTDFKQSDVADKLGIDLQDGKIMPLPDGSGLRFIFYLSNLPAQIPPEVIRYTWAFQIGSTVFQLQAKRSNLASVNSTEAPVEEAHHATNCKPGPGTPPSGVDCENFINLRGHCVSNYEGSPSSGCYVLAWLKGGFDMTNKTVTIDLPFNTRDSLGRLVAPEFHPGVVLTENQQAGMSIGAMGQAVASTSDMADFINGWGPYFVGPTVQLGVAPAGADLTDPEAVTFNQTATLNPDGTFTGTVSGLSNSNNTVYVRACSGATCAFTSVAP